MLAGEDGGKVEEERNKVRMIEDLGKRENGREMKKKGR